MAMKAKHAFGNLMDVEKALQAGKINEYDILFLDGDTSPKIGWIDANGIFRLVENEADFSKLEAAIATKADASDVESLQSQVATKADAEKVEALETELATKVAAEEIDAKIETAVTEKVESTISKMEFEVDVDYEISHKPDGTLVDYRDKEIRVMIPVDTQFELQNSGAGADANSYYIGFKAYAPNDEVVNFKEDLAEIITDDTMYAFEGNDFAGIDEDGRKFSIVWLPVAKHDDSTWTYYGANSNSDKYIGWHYSVEWYNANGKVIASDCIRINLSNENCHSSVKPYYIGEMMKSVEAMVEKKVAETESAYEIIEF